MQTSRTASWESSRARLALRLAAGALVVLVGADHYYELRVEHYAELPTIGTLFLLNFIGASACGLLLLAPLERIAPRLGTPATWLAALGGFAIGLTSLIGLLVSEHTPLFGYMELNYRPAVLVGLSLEAVAAALCAALLVADLRAVRLRAHRPATGDPTRDDPRRDRAPVAAGSSS